MFVYVLELEDRHYYVGIAEDLGLRLWTHFKGKGTGSSWTKKYKPIKVIHYSEVFPKTRKRAEIVETECTLRLAKAVGFLNVRGAGFSVSRDDYPISWDEKLDGVQAAKFDKMVAMPEKELKKLMKRKYKEWLKGKGTGRKPKE